MLSHDFKGAVSRYSVIFALFLREQKNGCCSRKCRGHQLCQPCEQLDRPSWVEQLSFSAALPGGRHYFSPLKMAVKTHRLSWHCRDAILGQGATLIYKLLKTKLFRAPQSSVVHMKVVLRSNQPLVWPRENFQRFIDTVVCKCCLSQSFRQQWTPCAKFHSKPVLCSDISMPPCRTTLRDNMMHL